LPDRSAATVAAWLAQHPTITAVCRDRSNLYAEGTRRGAPEAVQVVDRFHLVHNLRQALEAFLLNHRPALQAAAIGTAMALTPPTGPVPVMLMYRGRRRNPKPTQREEASRPPRHAPWVAIHEAVHALQAQGIPSPGSWASAVPRSIPTCAGIRRQAPNSRSGGHRRRC
jgi:hypothetical protein